MRHARFGAAVLAFLALASGARAGQVMGAVHGTVTGDAGVSLEDVTVTIQNQASGARRTVKTGADGRYEFNDLPLDGEYQVGVALPGFEPETTESVTLVPNAIVIVNFRLKLLVSESVAVSGAMPGIDPAHVVVQQTIDETLVRSLPLEGRNFIPLASLAAGFTGNPNYPSPLGQIYWTNNVIVDGASHFSKWRSAPRAFYSGYGLESIGEVRVLTNRFSAEYGDALAAVTGAVTKAGTDTFHGTALFFLQRDGLNATPTFAEIKPASQVDQYGATLGGPFVRQRTHFFGSYEGRRSRAHNIVVSPDEDAYGTFVPDDEDEHLLFMKVDHRLSDDHVTTARYNGQFFRWHNEPGGLWLPGSGFEFVNDVHTALAVDRLQLSPHTSNEARVQFARYVDVRTDLQPKVFVSRAGWSQEGGTLGPVGFGADPEDTLEAADTVTMLRGRHTVRGGGGAKYVRAHNPSLSYGRGAYYFAGGPDTFAAPYLFVQTLAPTPEAAFADPRSLSAFAFVQDDWMLNRRLTINLGARYDVERVDNVRGFTAPTDRNNVQPRAGAAWDAFGDGRTLVRAGAGLYTQQHLLYYINRVQLEGGDGGVTLSLAPGAPSFPTFPFTLAAFPPPPLPPRDIYQAAADFRNPWSFQWTVGVERLAGSTTISADYVYLNGRDLMSLVDANAPASNQKPAQRSVAQADATRPIPAMPGSYRKIITLGNLGESWYRALQVKAQRSDGPLHAVVSYTLSRAEDMDNYLLPEDSLNLGAERARADSDVRHNFTVGITWQPTAGRWLGGWTLSGIGVFRSGRPYTITWGDDRNGTTQNDARPGGRNTAETDSYHNVDLALARRFATRSAATIEGRIEAFNIFNTTNFDQYVGARLSPYYGQPVTAFPQRRIQLAAVVRF